MILSIEDPQQYEFTVIDNSWRSIRPIVKLQIQPDTLSS